LVCWEHKVLAEIATELVNAAEDSITYPSDRFDVIWAVKHPYDKLEVVGSEGVPGLDDKWITKGDVGGPGIVVGGEGVKVGDAPVGSGS
jgi:hypothetical protein